MGSFARRLLIRAHSGMAQPSVNALRAGLPCGGLSVGREVAPALEAQMPPASWVSAGSGHPGRLQCCVIPNGGPGPLRPDIRSSNAARLRIGANVGGVTAAARSVLAALVGDTDPPAPDTRSSKATHLRIGRTSDRVTVVPRSVVPPPAAKSAPARPLHSKLKRCSHSIEPTSDRLSRSPEASCRPQRRNRSGPSLTLQAQRPPTFEPGRTSDRLTVAG